MSTSTPRTVELPFGEVTVLSAAPDDTPPRRALSSHWPCPACAVRRACQGWWALSLTDSGGWNHRTVMICADCAEQLGFRADARRNHRTTTEEKITSDDGGR